MTSLPFLSQKNKENIVTFRLTGRKFTVISVIILVIHYKIDNQNINFIAWHQNFDSKKE